MFYRINLSAFLYLVQLVLVHSLHQTVSTMINGREGYAFGFNRQFGSSYKNMFYNIDLCGCFNACEL
ncbi:hypothetical protein Barb7_01380 [Bacteroidales bacterium Barb7]|nr:hypothetical protein Barb7_01380 [Bacteroidales bacterium Barb7]